MNTYLYKRFNDPSNLVLVFLAVLGLYGTWTYTQRQPGIDYYVAWTTAHATRNGSDYRIYNRQEQKRLGQQYRSDALLEGTKSRRAAFAKVPLLSATASPFLYTSVSLLSTGNYESSLTIWNALSLLGFSAAILLFCHQLGFSKTASLAIFVPCLFWMNAFHSDMRVANINSIQLGLLALAYYLLSRDSITVYLFLAGALIAMMVFLKPNLAPVPLLLLGAWLIQGQRRKFLLGLAGMAVGASFAFGAASLFFGHVGIWFEWLDKLFFLARVDLPATEGNYNLLRLLGLTVGAPGQAALAMAICALTLGFLWWGRKTDGYPREQAPEASHERKLIEYAQLIGMGCLVHMMASALVWLHYYVLAIPMLIVAFRPWSRAPAHGTLGIILLRLLPALVLLAFLNGPHWRLVHGDIYAAHAIANTASIVVLYVLGLWQLRFQDGRLPVRR